VGFLPVDFELGALDDGHCQHLLPIRHLSESQQIVRHHVRVYVVDSWSTSPSTRGAEAAPLHHL
jgi:hypothetical protein